MLDVVMSATGQIAYFHDPSTVLRAESGRWVHAAPFRRYAEHLVEASKLPWRVVALAADIPAGTMHGLLYGRAGRRTYRIRERDAAALLSVTPGWLISLSARPVPAAAPGEWVRALLAAGHSSGRLATLLGCTVADLGAIAREQFRVSVALALRVRALSEELGVWCEELGECDEPGMHVSEAMLASAA